MKKFFSLIFIFAIILCLSIFSACEFNANPSSEEKDQNPPTYTQYIVGVFRHNIQPDWDGIFDDALIQTKNSLRQMLEAQGFVHNVGIEQYKINYLRVTIPDIGEPNVILRQLGEPVQIEFRFRGEVVIVGHNVLSAQATFLSFDNDYIVSLLFDAQGAIALYNATQNVGEVIEIWAIMGRAEAKMDHTDRIEILMASPIIQTPIAGGSAIISGMGNMQTANELAVQINAGRLPLLLESINIYAVSVSA
ncbi:MAG: hypothetical protein FWE03_06685 [Firmicutes bacterium]|nr:hypothetical protein [Bacillota bacterium]